MKTKFLVVAGALLGAACTSPTLPDQPDSGNGALTQGQFIYACADATDRFCAAATRPVLPAAIASGATFDISFAPAPSEPSTTIAIASADYLTLANDGSIHATHPGFAGVIAETAQGTAVDFVNLTVHEVFALDLGGASMAPSLAPGATLTLHASPLDVDGASLAGALTYAWDASNASAATVSPSALDTSTATVTAVAPGTSVVRVAVGATFVAIVVTVTGGAP